MRRFSEVHNPRRDTAMYRSPLSLPPTTPFRLPIRHCVGPSTLYSLLPILVLDHHCTSPSTIVVLRVRPVYFVLDRGDGWAGVRIAHAIRSCRARTPDMLLGHFVVHSLLLENKITCRVCLHRSKNRYGSCMTRGDRTSFSALPALRCVPNLTYVVRVRIRPPLRQTVVLEREREMKHTIHLPKLSLHPCTRPLLLQ